MRDLVWHPQTGLMLDFALDDFGGPDQTELVKLWRDNGHRVRGLGEFICDYHRKHQRPQLYLTQRGSLLIAAHWPDSGLSKTHEIHHGMSTEHRRQVEYLQLAGEAAGYRVQTEVVLPNCRPDAVVYGGQVNMGIEAQHSYLSAPKAKARTTTYRRAGVEPVWFGDSGSKSKWLFNVPGVLMNPEVDWGSTPRRRTVTVVTGVRVIVEKRCYDIPNSTCPERRYGCKALHVIHGPREHTFADDLAAMVPSGELVPMRYRRLSGRAYDVLIVSARDKARYEAVTGQSAELPLKQAEPRLHQVERVACEAPVSVVGPERIQTERITRPLPPVGACGHWSALADSYCGITPVRRYLTGLRCGLHSPAGIKKGYDR